MLCDTFAVHFPHGRRSTTWPQLFGADTGDELDKFTRCAWTRGPDDVPLLDACPVRFVGRRVALVDAGPDHVCVILEPIEVAPGDAVRRPTPDVPRRARPAAGHDPTDRQRPT